MVKGTKQTPEHVAARIEARAKLGQLARKEAKLRGDKTYNGSEHKRCGTTLRHTDSGACIKCSSWQGLTDAQKIAAKKSAERYRRRKGQKALPGDEKRIVMRKVGQARQWTLFKYQVRRYWPELSVTEALNVFEQLLIEQAGRCAICDKTLKGRAKQKDELCIDHCHKTGAVKGLLCRRCNLLVHDEMTPEICLHMADYLNKDITI